MYRTEAILKQLAARVGEVDRVETKVVSFGNGDFHRARVKLTADKPLPRVVTFTPEGCDSMMFVVKYEKLPRFCKFCGKMGHEHLECGTGEYAEDDLQFGNWMLASEVSWHPSTPRVRRGFAPSGDGARGGRGGTGERGGRFSGRGGARGRPSARGGRDGGVWVEKTNLEKVPPRKRNSGEAGLDIVKGNELEDSATSPINPLLEGAEKNTDMSGAQRQLHMDDAGLALVAIPPPPPQYVPPKDKKRQKKDKEGAEKTKIEAGNKAGSLEERRQQ
jgi:hypothetical protein